MNEDSDVLRELASSHVASIRDGADAVVVHYAWKKSGRSDAAFAMATAALHADGQLDIRTGERSHLRLTPRGFDQLPGPQSEENDAPDDDRRTGDFVQLTRPQMQSLVREIFQLAARAGEAGLTASALAAIWNIEAQRAADLRGVIDDMLREGALRVERGERTVFFLG